MMEDAQVPPDRPWRDGRGAFHVAWIGGVLAFLVLIAVIIQHYCARGRLFDWIDLDAGSQIALGRTMFGVYVASLAIAGLAGLSGLVAVVQAVAQVRRENLAAFLDSPPPMNVAGIARTGCEILFLLAVVGVGAVVLYAAVCLLRPNVVYMVTGYIASAALLVIALQRRGRIALDWWLLTAGIAVVATFGSIIVRLPITLEGWDAHGFGMSGGEMNVLLLPWYHNMFMALWMSWTDRELRKAVD